MNCENFQSELPEYVEGSLAPDKRQAADQHLVDCADCRHKLQRAQAMTQTLSQEFQQSVRHLTLPPDFLDRLVTARQEETSAKLVPLHESSESVWVRFAWPVGIAAGVLVTSFHTSHVVPGKPVPAATTVRSTAAFAPPNISLQFVYCAPKYTFHREGNQVIDTLECDPRTVDISFHQDRQQKPL